MENIMLDDTKKNVKIIGKSPSVHVTELGNVRVCD